MHPIDLDHNATTPLLPEAWEAMRAAPSGNPASAHTAGRKARQALEDAREKVAALLGAHPDEVTFTSGATEANNLAVFGLVGKTPSPAASFHSAAASPPGMGEGRSPARLGLQPESAEATASPPYLGERPADPASRGVGRVRGSLLASPLEHPCVAEPLKQLEAAGFVVNWLPVDSRGVVRCGPLAPRADSDIRSRSDRTTPPALVSVMLANHETGALQPMRDIALSLPPGVPFHTDAAQAVGKVPVDFRDLGVTALTASAHKFGGPKGVGVLLLKRGTQFRPLMFGGHQQQGRRPGTEPVPLAVGMAAALEYAVRHMAANRAHLESLRARLWERLQAAAAPVVLNGPEIGSPDVVPTTLNVSFPGCRADVLLMALDLAGVACSTGSACSSGSLLPSPVLRAMGVPEAILRSAIRFSFGRTTSSADTDEAADRIGSAVRRLRENGPAARPGN